MKKQNSRIGILLIIIAIIVVIIVYVVSLGTVNSGFKEFKDNKEQAKIRHKKLVELIQKKEALKIKLDKKFKRIYFSVRVGLVLIWFTSLSIFYFLGFIKNIGDGLNYSEASILILIVFNFLTFGTLTNLENYLSLVKTKTENWIYGKYIDIDVEIESDKSEEKAFAKELNPY